MPGQPGSTPVARLAQLLCPEPDLARLARGAARVLVALAFPAVLAEHPLFQLPLVCLPRDPRRPERLVHEPHALCRADAPAARPPGAFRAVRACRKRAKVFGNRAGARLLRPGCAAALDRLVRDDDRRCRRPSRGGCMTSSPTMSRP